MFGSSSWSICVRRNSSPQDQSSKMRSNRTMKLERWSWIDLSNWIESSSLFEILPKHLERSSHASWKYSASRSKIPLIQLHSVLHSMAYLFNGSWLFSSTLHGAGFISGSLKHWPKSRLERLKMSSCFSLIKRNEVGGKISSSRMYQTFMSSNPSSSSDGRVHFKEPV